MDVKITAREERRKLRNIEPIYRGKQSRYELAEAEVSEDNDIMHVQAVPEECPTCQSEEELRQLIRNMPVSRALEWLVIHCTATSLKATVQAIINYWRNSLGWSNPGYNLVFLADGSFTLVADFNTICNGVKGFNAKGLQYSWIGGIDDKGKPIDNMTPQQHKMMSIAVEETLKRWPHLKKGFQGHHDFPNVAKACPCFNTKQKFSNILQKV
jgi:N-acetylmuramoyl-L-alanine amidase